MKSPAIWLFAFIAGTTASAHACEPDKAKMETSGLDLRWIKSNLVVYGIDGEELYEAHLDSPHRKVLLRLRGRPNNGLTISPDERYLVYEVGVGKEDSRREFHLFDAHSRADHVIPVPPHPAYDEAFEFLGFSPDSKALAWLDGHGFQDRGAAFARPALLVLETKGLASHTWPYPESEQGATSSCFTPQWSADGRSMLVNSKVGRNCFHLARDDRTLQYHRIDLATGQATKIDGGYAYDPHDYSFSTYYVDGGVRVGQSYPCLKSHRCTAYGEVLEAGNSRAWIQRVDDPKTGKGEERLLVQAGDAPAAMIATGVASDLACGGSELWPIDWVEGGKFLLYQFKESTYLHAMAENRSVPLPQLTGSFNWLPLATTNHLYYTSTDGNGDEKLYGPASAR